jgi:hypothetical protein
LLTHAGLVTFLIAAAVTSRLGIVWRSDRYVDVEREFGHLLDQLVAARGTS